MIEHNQDMMDHAPGLAATGLKAVCVWLTQEGITVLSDIAEQEHRTIESQAAVFLEHALGLRPEERGPIDGSFVITRRGLERWQERLAKGVMSLGLSTRVANQILRDLGTFVYHDQANKGSVIRFTSDDRSPYLLDGRLLEFDEWIEQLRADSLRSCGLYLGQKSQEEFLRAISVIEKTQSIASVEE